MKHDEENIETSKRTLGDVGQPLRGCGIVWIVFFILVALLVATIALLFSFPSYL
jgi:hypothetical protein